MEELEAIRRELHDHTSSDDLHFQDISNKLGVMKDNHLTHIEKSVREIAGSVVDLHTKIDTNTRETVENKTNISWIVKIGGGAWAIVLILFGAMVYIIREALTKVAQ